LFSEISLLLLKFSGHNLARSLNMLNFKTNFRAKINTDELIFQKNKKQKPNQTTTANMTNLCFWAELNQSTND